MAEIYRPLHLNAPPILFTDRRSAELTKYAANSFLATKIAFINEIADLAEKVGANVQEVARGIGLDNRIGQKFLHAGPGFGGSCFPKDAMALIEDLMRHATQKKYEYRHKWRHGDWVLWDNRSLLHQANPDYDMSERRYLYRLMLQGEAPV